MRKIAIIGCGINGIGCAIALAESGYDVHIFDKKKPDYLARLFKEIYL